jgi:hypothetical protein
MFSDMAASSNRRSNALVPSESSGNRVFARTYVNTDGEIVIEYTDAFYAEHGLIQGGIQIHEDVHRVQPQQYAGKGLWGYVASRVDYLFNQASYELPAYKAQLEYLDAVYDVSSNFSKPVQQILYYERQRVQHNIRVLEQRLD